MFYLKLMFLFVAELLIIIKYSNNMKAKSIRIIYLLKWSLNIIWYLNFVLIAGALYFLSNEYIMQDTYYFNEKITINIHKALSEQEHISGSETTSNIRLLKNSGRIMMNIKNSLSNTIVSMVALLLLEGIIISVLFYLRKLFNSFQKESIFSVDNIRNFKMIALYVALYSPLNWGVHLYKDWILTENVNHYNYFFTLDWTPDFVGLLVGAVIFAIAKIFELGFELEQENKAFV